MLTIETLTQRINDRGVKVNVSALKDEIVRLERAVLLETSFLVPRVAAALNLKIKDVKLNSSRVMTDFFYGYHALPTSSLTTSGQPSLAADALEPFADSIPDVKVYVQYRSDSRMINLLRNILKEVVFGDEVHTNFDCNGAVSGRFTSTSPNLQQIPAEYRSLFIPRKGFSFLCADLVQAEPQLARQLAGAPCPIDIHTETSEALGISRDKAKVFNIGIAYGMTPGGIAKLLGVSKAVAQSYLNAWRDANPILVSYINQINFQAERTGKVSIYDNSLTVKDDFSRETSAFRNQTVFHANRPFNIHVQGSLAKLLKVAMVNIQNFLDEHSPNSHIVLTIHDELVIELADTDLHLAPQILKFMQEIDRFRFQVKHFISSEWAK